MQEHSQCQEGLCFLPLWHQCSDISQDGYTTLHDTSFSATMESLVNSKLFWYVYCQCARATSYEFWNMSPSLNWVECFKKADYFSWRPKMFTALELFVCQILQVRKGAVYSTVSKVFEHVDDLLFQLLIRDIPHSNPLSFFKELLNNGWLR